jgi:hypothetical protein
MMDAGSALAQSLRTTPYRMRGARVDGRILRRRKWRFNDVKPQFTNMVDVNMYKTGTMPTDPSDSPETEEILKDPIIMKMLELADRQYREGKAIPLSKLISDLGFDEDEL